MRILNLALLAISLTLSTAQAASKASLPRANDLVKTTMPVKIRASTPDPSFGGKGEQIGWLKSGDLAVVLSVKSYISISGTEIWVEVAGKEDTSLRGWVYAGLAQNMGKGGGAALEIVPAEAPAPAAIVEPAHVIRADDFVENEDRSPSGI